MATWTTVLVAALVLPRALVLAQAQTEGDIRIHNAGDRIVVDGDLHVEGVLSVSGVTMAAIDQRVTSLEQQVETRTEALMLRSVNLAGGFATTVISDSVYCVKGYNEWIAGWARRGWLTSGKKPVKNLDLWQEVWAMKSFLELCPFVDVRIRWVKGHSTCPGNEEADRLAVIGRNMNPLRYK